MSQTRLIAPRASSSTSPRPMPLLGTLSLAGGSTGTKRGVLRKFVRPSARSPAQDCAWRDRPSRFERLAVGTAARRNYETAFGEFLGWSVSAGSPDVNEKNVEMCLLGFPDHLLEEGSALYKAGIAIASVADAMPELGMLASRPRLRRALRGFPQAAPPALTGPGGEGDHGGDRERADEQRALGDGLHGAHHVLQLRTAARAKCGR